MAHLFLASKMSDDLHGKAGGRMLKTIRDQPVVMTTRVPHVNELQLTAATGGAEASCYRCTVPFGVVVLIAGAVVTGVAYTFNSHGSTISVLGLVLLAAGLGLLGSSAICWRLRLSRRKDRRRESQTALMAGHGDGIA